MSSRSAVTSERNSRQHLLFDLVRKHSRHRRLDITRSNRIDRNSARSKLSGAGLGDADYPCLEAE